MSTQDVEKAAREVVSAWLAGEEVTIMTGCRGFSSAVYRRADELLAERTVTHRCPQAGVMSCCGRTPFELPRWHRMTLDDALVTCVPSVEGETQ